MKLVINRRGYGIFAHSCLPVRQARAVALRGILPCDFFVNIRTIGEIRPLKYYILFSVFLISLVTCHLSLVTSSFAGEAPKRIISLAPNMTELLFALGLGDRVVGVTTFCDYPEEAQKKAKIGGMSNPSLEAVVALRPDIVIMTTDGNPKEFEQRLHSFKINTYVFRTLQIQEFPRGIRDLGTAMSVQEKADRLAGQIETRLNGFSNTLRVTPQATQKKRVLFIVWPEPLTVAGQGSIADNAMTILGVENIAGSSKGAYPKYSIEEILRNAPDVIFIGRGRGMEEVSAGLLQRLKNVPAVKNGRVFYVSDNLYRLTPRTMKGIEELAGYMDK